MNRIKLTFWVLRFEHHLRGLARCITKVSGNEVTAEQVRATLLGRKATTTKEDKD